MTEARPLADPAATTTGATGATGADVADVAVLDLVADLAAGLRTAGVRYGHWKSNAAIDRSLTGDNDLDLLVAPDDAGRFLSVLYGLGFRAATPPPGRYVPGILDLFGLDDPTGRVVHAQAHFRLPVGDDMTKNVVLPFASAYLDSCADRGHVLPLPSVAHEYLVLVLRLGLKHCAFSSQLVGQGRATATERRELAHLEARVDSAEVERLRAIHLPTVPAPLLAEVRAALAPDAGRWVRARAGRRLLHALAPYARRPLGRDLVLRVGKRAWLPARGRLPGGDPRRRPLAGGLLIAVIGGDGAGKSTTVARLADTLGVGFVTRTGHLGKPPRSLPGRLARRVVRVFVGATPMIVPEDAPPDRFPGYGTLLWLVLLAGDRAREARRLRRAVARGEVVVCDRYPVPGLSTMDGPRAARFAGVAARPLARWLADVEARRYLRLPRPDLSLVLRVSPEVAVARRPEQDRAFVWRRAAEVHGLAWAGADVVVVDADRPEEVVQGTAARAVWDRL